MLNEPNINKLMEFADSKYTLVILASKRARHLIDHDPETMASGTVNAVSLALNEVVDGTLHWTTGLPLPGDKHQ